MNALVQIAHYGRIGMDTKKGASQVQKEQWRNTPHKVGMKIYLLHEKRWVDVASFHKDAVVARSHSNQVGTWWGYYPCETFDIVEAELAPDPIYPETEVCIHQARTYEKVCEVCGKSFVAANKYAKYCSPHCKHSHNYFKNVKPARKAKREEMKGAINHG